MPPITPRRASFRAAVSRCAIRTESCRSGTARNIERNQTAIGRRRPEAFVMGRAKDKPSQMTGTPAAAREELPFRIELWSVANPELVERVLARAFNVTLARAIYLAAQTEHPDRRITLARGE